PSRIGRTFLFSLRRLDFIHFGVKPLELRYLYKRLMSWDEARFISTWKVSSLPVKWLKATTAGIATKIPRAVETRASAMPPETTDIPPDPVAAMLRKALIIPTTVPNRP